MNFFLKTFFLILFLDLVYFKTYRTSAGPQQQTNEWCRISQLQTWISTIKLVEKYETANWSLRQGDEEVKKRIKQTNKQKKYIYIYISFIPWRRFVFKPKYWAVCLNIYIFCFILLFTSSSPCRKDQSAVLYFSISPCIARAGQREKSRGRAFSSRGL